MLENYKDKSKLQNLLISRRKFVGLSLLLLEITGCSTFTNDIKGDLKIVANGFDVYKKRNPNLKFPHRTWATWHDYLKKSGYNHTGESYILPPNEPIVACAAGRVIEAKARMGSGKSFTKRSGDVVKILHEEIELDGFNLYSTYYHMKENSRTVKYGDWVKRGDIIGSEGAPHKMHFKHYLSMKGFREQPNNFGINMGYMNYWDGKTDLEIPQKVAYDRNIKHYQFIREFSDRYIGPAAEEITEHSGPSFIHKGSWSNENQDWSYVEVFTLAKYIYQRNPELFKGSKKGNDSLIAEIYKNQPVILTLPLMKH